MNQNEIPTHPADAGASQPAPYWASELKGALEGFKQYADILVRSKRRDSNWAIVKRGFIGTVVLTAVCFYALFYAKALGFQADPLSKAVAVIPIQGMIGPGMDAGAERVVPIIERACRSPHVGSLVLDINSGGGAPSESERIIAAVTQCRTGSGETEGKKVYALINGVGASAAYMIAMKTDRVIAGRYSLVGSIGAIIRFNDASELANKIGVKEVSFKTATLKGGPSMISGTSPEEEADLQAMVMEMGDLFLEDVKKARGDKLKMDMKEIYSGKVWSSEQALEAGLIDEIAVMEDLKNTLFKDLKVHKYETKKSIAEGIGLTSLVRQVIADLQEPTIQ